jgi:hypothetical protein
MKKLLGLAIIGKAKYLPVLGIFHIFFLIDIYYNKNN